MNVYDFDKTIYDGDSTIDFYFFCLKKHPTIIIYLPKQCISFFRYKMNMINKTQFKENFYCFFKKLKHIDNDVHTFWNKNQGKIKKWYKDNQKKDDLIISASPHFLLQEICNREKINYLIASEVNKKNGEYSGLNCYGEEKIQRFNQVFGDKAIDMFFSDSRSDEPMAKQAKCAFIVKKDRCIPWYDASNSS